VGPVVDAETVVPVEAQREAAAVRVADAVPAAVAAVVAVVARRSQRAVSDTGPATASCCRAFSS
jgi:hypothetical protein